MLDPAAVGSVGRLAVMLAGQPEIFPLNYLVDHGTVVFRTGSGPKLAALQSDSPVAFEVDGRSEDDTAAWSVIVHGRLEPLVSFDPVTTDVLPLFPLQAGVKSRFVRVVPELVTGRRFAIVDQGFWRAAEPLRPPSPGSDDQAKNHGNTASAWLRLLRCGCRRTI